MRWTLLLLVFLAISPVTVGKPDIELHEKCLYPTVQITLTSSETGGSGVIVRSDKVQDGEYRNVVLSCGHVPLHQNQAQVVKVFEYADWSRVVGKKAYPCTWYAASLDYEWSVYVFTSEKKMPVAPLNMNASLYIGYDVFRIGCGMGDDPRLDYGKITKVSNDKDPLLRTNVFTVPGDSGGPLFHDRKVVGVAQSVRSRMGVPLFGISYVTPVTLLKKYSDETGGTLSFAWEAKEELPKLPFYLLDFFEMEVVRP